MREVGEYDFRDHGDREDAKKRGLSGYGRTPCSEHWAVLVQVDGETVLTIGHNHLAGVDDIDQHAETIRTAANHLLGFIGDAQNSSIGPKRST